jgi:hypothetical protein
MMSGIVKLRIINLIGAIIFATYGLLINALPVAIVNGFICLVDLYYLYDIFKAKEYFKVLEVMHNSEYVNYFLAFHDQEIKKYMPSFSFKGDEDSVVFFILRNSIPAGLICATKKNDDSLFIELDFVIPGYRDLKIGKYVYQNIFTKKKIKKLYSNPGNAKHDSYLQKMGFVKTVLNENPIFCLEIE